MDLNKKGQIIVYWIMVAVVIFIVGLAFSKPLVDNVSTVTNATNLNCTNPSNNVGTKATCVVVNMGLFYFIGILIASSIAVISGKKTLFSIMTSIFVFVTVVTLIMPLKDIIIHWRSSSFLNCASTTLVGAKMACIVVDLWLVYFVITAIAAGATFYVTRKVLPDE